MEMLFGLGSFIAYLSPVGVLLVAIVLLVVLVGALLIVQLRNNARLHDLTYPVYDYTVKEAEKRGNQILAEAQEKGRAVITAAEVEAAKVVGDRERDGEKLIAAYEKRLAELMHMHETTLKGYVGSAEHAFGALAQTLKQEAENSRLAVEREMQVFSADTKSTREALETETKKLIGEHLEKEFNAVKEGLQSYRQERMKLIERDIVAVIEQAVAITLRKQLPLKEHSDLVYEALEEAKAGGVFK